jgi:hypothetical protein
MKEVLYHGSKNRFSTFQLFTSHIRGRGIFFSDSIKYARCFGSFVYVCIVQLNNPKVYARSLDFTVDTMSIGMGDAEKLTIKLSKDGFDGVIIERSKVSTGTVREIICFNPSNITQCETLKEV